MKKLKIKCWWCRYFLLESFEIINDKKIGKVKVHKCCKNNVLKYLNPLTAEEVKRPTLRDIAHGI